MKWLAIVLHVYALIPDVVSVSLLMSVTVAINLFLKSLFTSDTGIALQGHHPKDSARFVAVGPAWPADRSSLAASLAAPLGNVPS